MKAALCILDGCNTKAFEKVLRRKIETERNDPFYITLKDAYFADSITSFPTVTATEHATLITACYPNTHGIVGMEWFDKEVNEYVDYFFLDNIELDKIVFGSLNIFTKIYYLIRGVQRFVDGLIDFAIDLNISHLSNQVDTVFEVLKDDLTVSFKEFIARGARCYSRDSVSACIAKINAESYKDYLKNNYKKESPKFLVYWKVGTDTKSHKYGPNSKELEREIEAGLKRTKDIVDYYLSLNEEIVLAITADHAQSSVTKFPDFEKELSQKDLEVRKYEKRSKDTDAILVNNGRMFYLYLNPEEEGGRYPRTQLITTLKKVLKSHPSVDLIFYFENGKIKVVNGEIEGFLDSQSIQDKLNAQLTQTGRQIYPNGKKRIEGILNSKRAGDIVVTLKEGYSTHRHKGDHGSLRAGDSTVPLLIHKFSPGKIKSSSRELIKHEITSNSVDVIPTILKLLGVDHPKAEGKVIKEVIRRYSNQTTADVTVILK